MAISLAAGSLIGGLGGSLLGGLFGRSSAKKSMAFQREMAKNAHQYEVADLRAAGLNPILSGTGGPGARASGGAMPSTPDFGGTAIAAMLAKKNIQQIDANIDLTKAKTGAIGGVSAVSSTAGDLFNFLKDQTISTAKDLKSAIGRYWSHVDGRHDAFHKKKSKGLTIRIPQSGKFK